MLVSTYSLNLLLFLQVQARQDSAFYPICFAVNLHANCPFRNSDTNFHSLRSNAKLNKNFTQWEQWGREKVKVLLINFIHGNARDPVSAGLTPVSCQSVGFFPNSPEVSTSFTATKRQTQSVGYSLNNT